MTKKGELIVVEGTNDILICMEESGNGLFSERLRNNQLGLLALVGRLNETQAKVYFENKNKKSEGDDKNGK